MEDQTKKMFDEQLSNFKKSLTGLAKSEDVQVKFDEFKTAMEKQFDNSKIIDELAELKGVVERQAVIIEEQKNGSTPEKAFSKALAKFVEEKAAKIMAGGKDTMSQKTDVVRAAIGSDTQAMRDNVPNRTAMRLLGMWDLFPKIQISPDSRGVYKYYDESTLTRAAAAMAENGTFPESAITWVERTLTIKKVGDSIPFSYESMRDIAWMESELRNFITNNLELVKDSALLIGLGTGSNPKGWNVYASDFTDTIAGDFEIETPTIWDVAMAMKTKVEAGKKGKYSADLMIINPIDFFKAMGVKDTQGRYNIPPFVAQDGSNCGGLKVYVTSIQPAQSLTVGDSKQAKIIHDGTTELILGEASGDFEADRKTLKGRSRFDLLVKTLDITSVYITDAIDDTIAAMTPATSE